MLFFSSSFMFLILLNLRKQKIPKPLLKLGRETILERMVNIFRNNGINEIAIVRGYLKEEFKIPNVTYYDNDNYMNSNILSSLFCAQ